MHFKEKCNRLLIEGIIPRFLFLIHQLSPMDYQQTQHLIEAQTTAWIVWSAVYAVAGAIIVVLNTLTVYTCIKTPSLRTRKHVMVVNLAIADLLYGAAGVPATMIFMFKPSAMFYYVLQTMNMFLKAANLFTLGVIAVERMHAIVWPIRHKVMSSKVYKISLAITWILSTLVTAAVQWDGLSKTSKLGSLVLLVAITGVFATTVACYVCIWISVQLRKRGHLAVSTKRDKVLALILLLVSGAFTATWGIPMVCLSIFRACKHCYQPTGNIVRSVLLFFAVQSLINPVIYCFRLPSFKASLKARIRELMCMSAVEPTRPNARAKRITVEAEMGSISGTEVNE